jgi:DNA polymerase-3 subunit delta'
MNPLQFIKFLDHHAYFIHSFKDSAIKLKEYLKDKFGISHTQNPDFYHEKFETFGIDESRKIKENHLSKSFKEGNKRIFIVEASNITHEAQNALLKIFEEPHEDTHFFLIMPSSEVLLPTLRSRLLIIEKQENKEETQILKDAEKFLKLSKKEKIDFVDGLAKRISDEKANRSDAQEFLTALEITLYKKEGLKNPKGLKAILKAKDYLNDRSPSIKQLLEYVALNI